MNKTSGEGHGQFPNLQVLEALKNDNYPELITNYKTTQLQDWKEELRKYKQSLEREALYMEKGIQETAWEGWGLSKEVFLYNH